MKLDLNQWNAAYQLTDGYFFLAKDTLLWHLGRQKWVATTNDGAGTPAG